MQLWDVITVVIIGVIALVTLSACYFHAIHISNEAKVHRAECLTQEVLVNDTKTQE